MYKENKTTTYRPKVRFCQNSLKNSIENLQSLSKDISMKKPRVRSIINLDNNSKIIFNKNLDNLVDCKKNFVEIEENDSILTDKKLHDDSEKPITVSDDKNNEKKEEKSIDRIDKIQKFINKDDNKIIELKKSDIIEEKKKNCVKIDKSKNYLSKKLTKKSSTVINNDKISSNTTRTTTTTTTTTMNSCKDKQSNLLTSKKNIKPSIKTLKTRSKNSPIKKTILRDVSVSSTKVYVGPGIERYYPQTFKREIIDESKDTRIREKVISEKKLNRPEYNSIICTIDELKKVKSEKFITDVDNLPFFYKNLINEKVSAALDFPPDETIFKNLIDLSINEDQLPSRFTRSKDPEPRHKDVNPKLSDFYNPSYSKEYCSAFNIKPIIPDIISNWSPFVISDKIFGWKYDMDQ